MATLYITEFSGLGQFNSQIFQNAPACPPLADQKLTITTTSTASTTFSANTHLIQVETDAICSLAFSTTTDSTVSATTSAMRLAAGETRLYGVNPGFSVAVVTNT